MAVEYDLVILGGTPEGYEAAQLAVQWGARVALVLQGQEGPRSPLQTLGSLWTLPSPEQGDCPPESGESPWRWAIQRAQVIADTLTSGTAQALLAQGVDVIAEAGRLTGDRPLQVETASRRLTTRALLLAPGSRPHLPDLPGLATIPHDTPESFLRRDTLPASVAILGSAPLGLALALALCRWGIPVTLLTPQARVLGQEDPDVSQWIKAQLRAEGVKLHLGARVTGVTRSPESSLTLTLPGSAITAESLVIAVPPRPNLSGLGLEYLGLREDQPLTVNRYLQTRHPRIYGCGTVLGGYDAAAIARQEAQIAVTNALFWNRCPIDYRTLPYALPTQPEMARVGLTEPQARHRYDADDLLTCTLPLYDTPKAQWRESTIGFCKLIAHRRGTLLGVHGVGPEASEWVQTLGLLMAQKTPWPAIARYPTLPHSLTDLLRQATRQWERDRWQPGHWRRDWAENWCNWRRSR